MAQIALRDVSLGFRGPLVLDRVNLTLEPGERVCLLGRNGTGKTTLLRLFRAKSSRRRAKSPGGRDSSLPCSRRRCRKGSRAPFLTKSPAAWAPGRAVGRVPPRGAQIVDRRRRRIEARLDRAQHALEIYGGWSVHQEVETVLSRMSLDADAAVAGSRPA